MIGRAAFRTAFSYVLGAGLALLVVAIPLILLGRVLRAIDRDGG